MGLVLAPTAWTLDKAAADVKLLSTVPGKNSRSASGGVPEGLRDGKAVTICGKTSEHRRRYVRKEIHRYLRQSPPQIS